MGTKSGIDGVLDVAVVSGGSESLATTYATPDGRQVTEVTNAVILFSDDFGGTSLNTATGWDVLDGGLQADQALPSSGKSFAQGAIGSGTSMGNGVNGAGNSAITVSSSNVAIAMGTTNGAELWLLSQQAFAGTEDLFFTFEKSQCLAANSIQIGLVEVDPTTLVPLLNPNLAHAFTNAGLAELGTTTVTTTYSTTAIGDSSGAYATGGAGITLATMVNTMSEFLMEFHAEDLIVSNGAIDSAAARNTNVSRVSSQVPNDGKVYKLAIRLRNVSTPASSTVATFGRVMIWNSQEMRVEVASGRGDTNAQKGIGVNLAGAASSFMLASYLNARSGLAVGLYLTVPFLNAAGTPAAQAIKAGTGTLFGGQVWNSQASTWAYAHFYNVAAASVVMGTTAAILTVAIPPNSVVNLADVFAAYGVTFTAANSYALTGGAAANDATAIGTAGVAGATIGYY